MRYIVALFLAAMIGAMGITHFSSIAAKEKQSEEATDESITQHASMHLGISLYKTLSQKADRDNLFFSPYNISEALSMVYMGARGSTQKELQEILAFPDDPKTTAEEFYKTNLDLTSLAPETQTQLSLANSLWIQKNLSLEPSFLDSMQRYYQGALHETNFATGTAKARELINDWVSKNTNSKILGLLKNDNLSKDTRLVLISAIYFMGKWVVPFDRRYTHEAPFTIAKDAEKMLPFMLHTDFYPYYSNSDYSLLEIPYESTPEGPSLAMIILLPQDEEGLYEVEKKLTIENLEGDIAKMKPQNIDLHLPKFKMGQSLALREALQLLGLKNAFTADADFSGITRKETLAIDQILHQAFISVDEAGTEAAAASAVAVSRTLVFRETKITEFKANHPFLFFIREKKTGATLFLGRVVNPG